jgi:hypothetical protein
MLGAIVSLEAVDLVPGLHLHQVALAGEADVTCQIGSLDHTTKRCQVVSLPWWVARDMTMYSRERVRPVKWSSTWAAVSCRDPS